MPFYDPRTTLMWHYRGTVLSYCWKRCLFAVISTAALCPVWDRVREAKTAVPSSSAAASASFSSEEKFIFHLFRDAEQIFGLLSTFVTFLLGFYNATVYNRWWTLRDKVRMECMMGGGAWVSVSLFVSVFLLCVCLSFFVALCISLSLCACV